MLGIPLAVILVLLFWPVCWAKLVNKKIEAEVIVHVQQVTVGDHVPLTIVIRNLSWVPCPFVEVTLELPTGLSMNERELDSCIRWRTFLLMRQVVQIQTTCYARRRGLQSFHRRDMMVHISEGLGFRPLFISQPMTSEIVVVPCLLEDAPEAPQIQELLGKIEVVRWLHPDETLLRGIRTYQLGDPFKHIAWQASARSGTWMTKQFSSSTESTVTLLVNAQFYEPHWQGVNADEFERLCALTATWARALEVSGVRCQFATNAANPNYPKQRWYGEQRADGIRAILGRVQAVTNGDFTDIMKVLPQHSQVQDPVVIFTSYLTQVQWQLIRRILSDGHSVTIVSGPRSEMQPPHIAGLTWVETTSVTWKGGIALHA